MYTMCTSGLPDCASESQESHPWTTLSHHMYVHVVKVYQPLKKTHGVSSPMTAVVVFSKSYS